MPDDEEVVTEDATVDSDEELDTDDMTIGELQEEIESIS